MAYSQKFAPAKVSRYRVISMCMLNFNWLIFYVQLLCTLSNLWETLPLSALENESTKVQNARRELAMHLHVHC